MSEGRLEGKNVVVSGGAAGVGGAASKIFASEGAYVAIVDVQEKVGVNLAERINKKQGNAFFVKCDVSVAEEVENAIETINDRFENSIDVLFNHAGTVIIKPFLETTESEWDWMMDVNVKSMYLMTRAVLPSMLENGGSISIHPQSLRLLVHRWKYFTVQVKGPVICSLEQLPQSFVTRAYVVMLYVLDLSRQIMEFVN